MIHLIEGSFELLRVHLAEHERNRQIVDLVLELNLLLQLRINWGILYRAKQASVSVG